MTAVLASYVKLSTMVDGTLRVVLDIEPKHAADAFALLGSPGTPIAIARITDEAAVKHDTQPEPEKAEPKRLPLSSKVALMCGRSDFRMFLLQFFEARWSKFRFDDPTLSPEEIAACIVREVCRVKSRSEIQPNTKAANLWLDLEAQFHHYQRTGQRS